jgi:hypothetical protein
MTRRIHTAEKGFHVSAGDGTTLCTGEARYTFTVTAGRPARTWADGMDGNFHPAEAPTVDLTGVQVRFHPKNDWMKAEGAAFDLLSADATDAWLLAQIDFWVDAE